MQKTVVLSFLAAGLMCLQVSAQTRADQESVEHVKVYYEKGMYGGWPANYGVWNWGDEILVGFSKRFYKDLGPEKHNYDKEKPVANVFARSINGGKDWVLEDPGSVAGFDRYADPQIVSGTDFTQLRSRDLKEPINFAHPDFAMTVRTTVTKNTISRYYFSYDRGHTWNGPFELPNFAAKKSWGRTDYLVDGKNECTLFTTLSKKNGDEGIPVCLRTTDGGASWSLLSRIGSEPKGFSIMPASVRLSRNNILTLARRREKERRFIASYLSENNGKTWTELGNAATNTGIGNPPALIKMRDGRLCLIYGFRASVDSINAKSQTSDIRARISEDNGRTWSRDYILRNDGSGQDIGYPRVVQRQDGKIVAVYYFMDNKTGPERYIAASIWDPPSTLEY